MIREKVIWIAGVFFLATILGYWRTKDYKKDFLKALNPKEHPFWRIYPMCLFLMDGFHLKKRILRNKRKEKQLGMVYLGEDIQEVHIAYWCRKMAVIWLVFLFCNGAVFVLSLIRLGEIELIDGRYIQRLEAGEGTKEIPLTFKVKEREGNLTEDITIFIEERQYNKEELLQKQAEAKKYIKEHYLGMNIGADKVTEPFMFMKDIPNNGIKITWETKEDGLIGEDGMIYNEHLTEEQQTHIEAVLTYGETEERLELPVVILPKPLTERETIIKKIKEAILCAEESSSIEKLVELPNKVEDKEICFEEEGPKTVSVCVVLFLALTFLSWVGFDKNLEKKLEQREMQLMADYPELINKFTLLLGAGLTIKGAWGKVAMEYQNKRRKGTSRKRYAYEEWLFTWFRLSNGLSESVAFEQFGRRIGLLPYLKFSSLLVQNLKKGSDRVLELLEYEAIEAFEERKEVAKRLGEEAGTKLIFPMMIMLIIVLGVIVVPAFLAF